MKHYVKIGRNPVASIVKRAGEIESLSLAPYNSKKVPFKYTGRDAWFLKQAPGRLQIIKVLEKVGKHHA